MNNIPADISRHVTSLWLSAFGPYGAGSPVV